MNKETMKVLWEIYNDLVDQQVTNASEDYPQYDIIGTIEKIKTAINKELE